LNSDNVTLIFALIIMVMVILIFIKIASRLRKGGGSQTTVFLGTTDLFYDRDKEETVKTIVEQKAGKKKVAQNTTDSDKP